MPRCMPFRRVFYSLSVVLLVAGAAFAQFTASIQGVVQDQSGASVPKATILLVNVATGVTTIATSDDSGNYRFVSLAPGSYKITAKQPAFRSPKSTSRCSPNRT